MSVGRDGIIPFEAHEPLIHPEACVAPTAVLVGNVEIGAEASIWYGCILRGDVNKIVVGARSNLQDGTIVHCSPGEAGATIIGAGVLVGHGALLHACELEDGSFVGMRAVVLNRAVVESGALVAAGALVTEGTRVPSGEVWGGTPARRIGPLQPATLDGMRTAVDSYVALARRHAAVPQAGWRDRHASSVQRPGEPS